MHESLIPELAEALAEPLGPPPVPIFDVHMHADGSPAAQMYFDAARLYGVDQACNLPFGGLANAMREQFGDFFLPCGWPRVNKPPFEPVDWGRFHAEWVDGFDELVRRGMRSVKFKPVPWEDRSPQIWLDDGRIAPLLDACTRRRIHVQVHVAHPSCWWPSKFDPAVCGPKSRYLEQLDRALSNHPNLLCLSVHMGSHPEGLGYLAEMMDTHPNYYIDTSATKWVVRELSAKPDEAREFFIRYADRICFGSDLVVTDDRTEDYYTSRFHVQRLMWETDVRTRSMIADPDAPADGPYLNGLALPEDVLAKIYRTNALSLLNGE